MNYELCFQACWASCWPRYHAILSFCVSLIHIACAKPEHLILIQSRLATFRLQIDFCTSHMSANLQLRWGILRPSDKLKPISVQFTTKRWKPGSLKATTRCFGAKPWKNPVSFLPKIPWLGWGAEDSHLKSPTDLSSPGHWSRRFIQHCLS